ncbi:MAG: hypothetical protein JWM11_7188 [Planctomycetaceae bacterium]|nr:hypothetical protein [Planctomycetaceae bacterium]
MLVAALIVGSAIIGVLSVKRIVNGNADLSGNYRIWRANLSESTQPGRHLNADTGMQDPDSYPPITYALFAPLATVPLPLLAALWYVMNLACTVFLWQSLSVMLSELPHPDSKDLSARSTSGLIPSIDARPGGELSGEQSDYTGCYVAARPGTASWISRSLTDVRILKLASLAILPAWISTLLIGQHTLLQMSLVVAATRTDVRRVTGSLKAATLLALAIVMKILPVVFLLPYVIRRQFVVLLFTAVIGCGLVFGLGSLFFGIQKNCEFQSRWLQFAARGPENRPPDPRDPNTLRGSLRDKNQSIEAVLARLLMDIPIHQRDAAAPRVNLAAVEASAWRICSSGLVAMCLLIGILTLVRSHWVNMPRTLSETGHLEHEPTPAVDSLKRLDSDLGRLAILSLIQLFISPVVWSHYYVWLVLPLAFVLSEVRLGRRNGIGIYAVWLVLIPTLGFERCRAVGVQLWVNLAIYAWICWPAFFARGQLRGG